MMGAGDIAMRLIGVLLLAALLGAQAPERDKNDVRLPSGKSQKQEILKSEFEKSKAEAAELADLAEQLKTEIEKSDYQLVDLRLVKKAEEIERLAKRIKDRMRRNY
jgi:Tfp pilus assembly protein PilO